MTELEMLEAEKYWCENCCNWDKEHVLPDAQAKCKLTGVLCFAQESGRECKCFNVPAENVIVPPCKVGQELWDIHYNKPRKWEVVYLGYNGEEWHINIHWWKDRHNFKTMSITYPFVGKMWYLTKEEAEEALKGGVQG